MHHSEELESIGQHLRSGFEARNEAREEALRLCREIIQNASRAIRSIHRKDFAVAKSHSDAAHEKLITLKALLTPYPDLYYSGYVHDAQKEYVEAEVMFAIIGESPLPTPEALTVEPAAYLHGLAEAASETRRYLLDCLRHEQIEDAENLLETMDAIYDLLITFDFPDALTEGLRRTVDNLRAVLERSRADLTLSLTQYKLRNALSEAMKTLGGTQNAQS